jgi:hypothetical protein
MVYIEGRAVAYCPPGLRGSVQPHLHSRATPIFDCCMELDLTRTFHILNSVEPLQKSNHEVACLGKSKLLCQTYVNNSSLGETG